MILSCVLRPEVACLHLLSFVQACGRWGKALAKFSLGSCWMSQEKLNIRWPGSVIMMQCRIPSEHSTGAGWWWRAGGSGFGVRGRKSGQKSLEGLFPEIKQFYWCYCCCGIKITNPIKKKTATLLMKQWIVIEQAWVCFYQFANIQCRRSNSWVITSKEALNATWNTHIFSKFGDVWHFVVLIFV